MRTQRPRSISKTIVPYTCNFTIFCCPYVHAPTICDQFSKFPVRFEYIRCYWVLKSLVTKFRGNPHATPHNVCDVFGSFSGSPKVIGTLHARTILIQVLHRPSKSIRQRGTSTSSPTIVKTSAPSEPPDHTFKSVQTKIFDKFLLFNFLTFRLRFESLSESSDPTEGSDGSNFFRIVGEDVQVSLRQRDFLGLYRTWTRITLACVRYSDEILEFQQSHFWGFWRFRSCWLSTVLRAPGLGSAVRFITGDR